MTHFAGKQARRDHPDDPSTLAESGIGQLTHETYAATPVDEIDAPAGDQSPEGTGRVPVAGITRGRRPAEHADRAESHHERNLSDRLIRSPPASGPGRPGGARRA